MQAHGIEVVTPPPRTYLEGAAIRISDAQMASATSADKPTWSRLPDHGMVVQMPNLLVGPFHTPGNRSCYA